jgi:putative membrane protein
MLACGPAFAASTGDVIVSNTETVQAYLNASGKVDVARVYEQIAMQGKGTVDLVNPVESKGLRNLDGFGGFDVKDGQMVGSYTVDGEKRLRSVSDYTKKLPLEVDVKYFLDGKEVKPGDVVGQSGNLKVQYTVRNVTGQPQDVTFNDGTGKDATASEDVVIPMVGSLSTVLPSNFTDVRSDEANMAGDGHGGTKMSFTMTLFGPIGKPEATFGYEARISDGVIPKASISALPVSPLDSPSFKGGAESYKGGAETGATLTAGATEIDANLLKLRDGAGDLLAGLIKLKDGANQLHDGLAGEAAPGAAKLADGANQAAAGAGDLSSGVGQLDDGAKKLSAGSKDLAAGADDAKAGAGQVAGGADQVADGSALLADGLQQIKAGVSQLPSNPDVSDGTTQLKGALDAVIAGIGDAKTADTLLWGIAQMQDGTVQLTYGLDHKATGVPDPTTHIPDSGGVKQVLETLLGQLDHVPATKTDKPGAKQALEQIRKGLSNVPESKEDPAGAIQAIGSVQQLLGCPDDVVQDPATGCTKLMPDVPSALTTKITLAKVKAGLAQADGGLAEIYGGLGSRNTPGQTALFALNSIVQGIGTADTEKTLLYGLDQISGGLTQVQGGLSNPKCDEQDPSNQKNPCGIQQVSGLVSAGIDQLVAGIADSLTGVLGQASAGADDLAVGADQLAGGAGQLNGGLGQLSGGATQLADGAGQLADGTGKARDGASKLADGNNQIAAGANQLSSGLGDAATGSGQLADGLGEAAGGAPKLKDGAQKLSDQGTKKLIEAGKSTAADYGQKYALIEAGAKRAQTEGMAYGAPTDAAGQTAYSYELAGADGEGGRNLGRGLGAAAVFALAGGAAVLRRRFI